MAAAVRTITQPRTLHLNLVTPSLQDRIAKLLDKLRSSKLLNEDELQWLEAWQKDLQESIDEEQYFLCELLDIISSAQISNPSDQEEMGTYYTETLEILKNVLPQDKTLEECVNSYYQYKEEYESGLFPEQIREIEQIFETAMRELHANANQVNQHLMNTFEDLKKRILALADKQESLRKEEADQLKNLKERIEKADAQLKKTISKGMEIDTTRSKIKRNIKEL